MWLPAPRRSFRRWRDSCAAAKTSAPRRSPGSFAFQVMILPHITAGLVLFHTDSKKWNEHAAMDLAIRRPADEVLPVLLPARVDGVVLRLANSRCEKADPFASAPKRIRPE
jgi:hypothetical protein